MKQEEAIRETGSDHTSVASILKDLPISE